jgi:cobalt-zinc-cadmium efflux system membrane fusion protein
VGPGEDLVEVADLALVWVDTQVPVRELARMEIGNRVRVRWNGADLEALGTIAYLAPEIDSASQTGLARIELPNPNGMWRPGLFVDVQAEVNPEVVPLSLPTSALVADPDAPGQFVVFVGLEPGHFEARPVKVLRSEDGVVAVQGDLKPGDHVAAGDTLFLKAVWMGEGGMEE